MIKEIIAAIVIVAMAIFLLNPFHLFMPTMIVVCAVTLAFAALAALTALVVAEQAIDEREDTHRMHAGRAAFLIGAIIATVGIAVQSFAHAVDPWLVATLASMVVAKIATRVYSAAHC